jgi:RNA polymerase sigma factor (sigma-70 family)
MSDEAGLTDGQLLGAFIDHRDEAAFEALVRRHAAMVWGVCLRALGHSHDAEDAFQATFIVLVRRAGSIWPRDMVGNWLYGVAYRTALKAKGAASKRKAREKQVDEMPVKEVHDENVWSDLKPLLDRELSRLGDKYRVPVVLCDLEGKSQREAARQLGWPEGTLMTRLARARALLAKRLTKQGIVLSAGGLALALSQHAASACAPAPLLTTTIKAATLIAAGKAAAVATSASVAALSEGVLQAMFLTKIKSAMLIVFAVTLIATGGGFATHQVLASRFARTNEAPIVASEFNDDFDDGFAFFQDRQPEQRDGGRRPESGAAAITGKVMAVAADGKSFTIATPPANRGDEPGKLEIKLNDKSKLTFSNIGPGAAKIAEGLSARVVLADGSRDTAASATFVGAARTSRDADLQGKIAGVSKDGKTLTFEFPPTERGGAGKTVEVKVTPKTAIVFSGVNKGKAKLTEGYLASIALVPGSKDTADAVHVRPGQQGERGVNRRPDVVGSIFVVSKDGKTLNVTVAGTERGTGDKKMDFKLDDNTQIQFNNVGLDGDKFAENYRVMIWLAAGSKDSVAKLFVNAPEEPRHTILRGKVTSIAKDTKSFTLELPGRDRERKPLMKTVSIGDNTRVIYSGVGPDGARLTEGYMAEVTLDEGSPTMARQVLLGTVAAGGERR